MSVANPGRTHVAHHRRIEVHPADLRAAVNAVLSGQPASSEQWPSMGCSIKWKPGNTPAYVGAA